MTIKEIAHLAGVSTSTVSKIMNGKDNSISQETRERVLRIVKDYHYKPYSAIITANSPKTLSIGVIIRDITDSCMVTGGIISAASEQNYSVLFRESSLSKETEVKNIMAMQSLNVDGIIWEPIDESSITASEYLEQSKIPYITVNNNFFPDAYNIDYVQMGYRATEILIQANHREIACCLNPGTRTERFFEGYRRCLFDHNLIYDQDLVFRNGEIPLSKLANHNFSGIVVSHYATAAHLYKLIENLRYMVPYDFSIVSLKDDARLHTDYPPISAIVIPHRSFNYYVTQNLIQIIEKKEKSILPKFSYQLDTKNSIDIPYNARIKKVISIGSINVDNYMIFEELPYTGKTVTAPTSVTYPGGKCINEAIGVAKLGHNVAVIGRVGDDADADFLYSYINNFPVDMFGVKRTKGDKTGQGYIFVQQNGDSMISIMSGANSQVKPSDITDNERLFANAGYCLMQTEIPVETITEASHIAKKYGLTTILKPSACSVLPESLLRNTDIIIPNLEELNEIVPGKATIEEKTEVLLSAGIKTVIVTLGARGCYLKNKTISMTLPAAEFVSLDNTGAGDAFIAALTSYMLYGYDIYTAAKIANYAAGFSTTRQGAAPSLIDKGTLESYIRQREPALLNMNHKKFEENKK